MNLNFIYPTISLVLLLVFISSPLFLFNTGKEEKLHYSFLRYFPCEIASPYDKKKKIFSVVLSALLSISYGVTYTTSLAGLNHALYLSALILYVISSIALFFSVSYSLENYRGHLIAFTVMYVSLWGGDLMMGAMFFVRQERIYAFNPYIELVMGIIGIIFLLLMFLPQLKHWSSLEKSEENGKVIYVRPKISPLGTLEWLSIFVHGLNIILLLINSLIIE